MAGRGRPRGSIKENPRHNIVGACMNDYEVNLLDNLCLTLNKSRSEIIREALIGYATIMRKEGKCV